MHVLPFLHHVQWAGWDQAAHRSLNGLPLSPRSPALGLAEAVPGSPRALSAAEIEAVGPCEEVERQAYAALDAMPHGTLEVIETTKGFIGFGKKPLAVRCRGEWAAERLLSEPFMTEVRAMLGGPQSLAVAIPTRGVIYVRNHDAPHFGTAKDFVAAVVDEYRDARRADGAALLSDGVGVCRDHVRLWGSRWVAPPTALSSADTTSFPRREVEAGEDPKRPRRAKPEELEAVPDAPTSPAFRLLGRHRALHHYEVEVVSPDPGQLTDDAREALAQLARARPGTVARPITGVRVLLPDGADELAFEWSLRHRNVGLWMLSNDGLRRVRGPSARSDRDNLELPLSSLK